MEGQPSQSTARKWLEPRSAPSTSSKEKERPIPASDF
jgi:hypothetical protein